MTAPLSIRFEREVLNRLRQRAATIPGATASGLVQQLVDEGLRQAEHPGIVYRDGPSGRRAGLVGGPDVWEVVSTLARTEERGEASIGVAAEALTLSVGQIRTVLHYYGTFPDEIDREVTDAETTSLAAEAAWHRQQDLLA